MRISYANRSCRSDHIVFLALQDSVTTMVCSPPGSEKDVPFVTLPVGSSSTAASPDTGQMRVPLVPTGVVVFNANAAPSSVQLAPNQPSGVVKPPSAEGRPDVCGAIDHVAPCGVVTVNPST